MPRASAKRPLTKVQKEPHRLRGDELLKKGDSQAGVARELGLSRQAVNGRVRRAKKGGKRARKARPHAGGNPELDRKLVKRNANRIEAHHLPPYAFELMPVEGFNGYLKTGEGCGRAGGGRCEADRATACLQHAVGDVLLAIGAPRPAQPPWIPARVVNARPLARPPPGGGAALEACPPGARPVEGRGLNAALTRRARRSTR